MPGPQRVQEPLPPGPHQVRQGPLQFGPVVLHLLHLRRMQHQMDAHQHRLRQISVERLFFGLQPIFQEAADSEPHIGAVVVPGHEHQAGEEAPVDVPADEQPHGTGVLDAGDLHRGLQQFIPVDLE